MSAFFVQPGCIDDVVRMRQPEAPDKDLGASLLGRTYWLLNAEAVIQRYELEGTAEAEDYRQEAARYTYRLGSDDPVQQYRSLSCLTYQCCEGRIPDTVTYRELELLEDKMTEALSSPGKSIRASEAYKKARWDRAREGD